MQNRISSLFETKKSNILSIYFTAGYPSLADTVPTMLALQEAGVDMLEIGMPFSDPLADGPVIQDSSMAAIKNGMTIPVLFEQLKDIRMKIHIPLILMGYLNPVLQYGVERFAQKAAEIGIDGIILPDLPMQEYLQEYKPIFDSFNLYNIFLITPQTTDERVKYIDANSNGFIYMVSSASTTGTKDGAAVSQLDYFERINKLGLKNPRLIGFGIKDSQSFKTACKYAQGAIIGTAFIKHITSAVNLSQSIKDFVNSVKGV
jgi:tryptophan synthase alpha chain